VRQLPLESSNKYSQSATVNEGVSKPSAEGTIPYTWPSKAALAGYPGSAELAMGRPERRPETLLRTKERKPLLLTPRL